MKSMASFEPEPPEKRSFFASLRDLPAANPADVSIKIMDESRTVDKVFVRVTPADGPTPKSRGREKWKKLLRRTASFNTISSNLPLPARPPSVSPK